ncbi:hypothetical protein HRbin21_01010 [bacterium HR21]|nr:hypothetical protein HRbin21_01010 [bacterium HR21]
MGSRSILLWLLVVGGVVGWGQRSNSCDSGDCRPGARCRGDLRVPLHYCRGQSWQRCVHVDSIRRALLPLPICLELDSASLPPAELRTVYFPVDPANPEGERVLVFSLDSVWQDLCCAQRSWACICGKQDLPCACKVKVRFITDSSVFRPGSRAAASTWGGMCDSCRPDFDILLNVTRWFITSYPSYRSNSTSKVHRFFVNRSLIENYRRVRYDPDSGYVAYDLCLILIHELGHVYGLNHMDLCDSSYTGGVMHHAGPAYWWNISEDERCAFAKLYCPEMVGIIEDRREYLVGGFNKVCFSPSSFLPIIVRVYTLEGRLVYSRFLPPHRAYICEDLSTEGLARGVYVVQITENNNVRCILLYLIP